MLFAIYVGGLLALTPLAGWWVDRSGPRGPLLAGLLGLSAATTPLRTRARNLGFVISAVSMGVLIGPAHGGILADTFGRHAPFLFAAALALTDGLLRLWLIRPLKQVNDDLGTIPTVLRVPGASLVCAIVALGAALVAITEPVLPLRLAELGWSATETGLVFGAAVLATALPTLDR